MSQADIGHQIDSDGALCATLISDLPALHVGMGGPTQAELDWLQAQGISRKALAEPWPIGACNIQFTGSCFDFDPDGDRAITIAIIDGGEIIDIAAWQPSTGELSSWRGTAFAIGQDAVFNSATYVFGGALHVHRTPLDWLRAGRRGIVILRRDLAHAYLAQRQHLAFEDEVFASRVQRWIQPPRPRARILVSKRVEPNETREVLA